MEQTSGHKAVAEKFAALPKAEKMQMLREDFERTFGVDSATRTKDQWKALVAKYTIDTVCAMENMTKEQVEAKCNETFSQRLKRQFKMKPV